MPRAAALAIRPDRLVISIPKRAGLTIVVNDTTIVQTNGREATLDQLTQRAGTARATAFGDRTTDRVRSSVNVAQRSRHP